MNSENILVAGKSVLIDREVFEFFFNDEYKFYGIDNNVRKTFWS